MSWVVLNELHPILKVPTNVYAIDMVEEKVYRLVQGVSQLTAITHEAQIHKFNPYLTEREIVDRKPEWVDTEVHEPLLPKSDLIEPREGEDVFEFRGRCIVDAAVVEEFPLTGHRDAFCADQWDWSQVGQS